MHVCEKNVTNDVSVRNASTHGSVKYAYIDVAVRISSNVGQYEMHHEIV
jgi:hypothetical protein